MKYPLIIRLLALLEKRGLLKIEIYPDFYCVVVGTYEFFLARTEGEVLYE